MKNSLSKVVLAAMIASAPLAAADYSYDTHSLFAIEGGITNVDIGQAGPTSVDVEDEMLPSIGLKIGAEGEDFRVFLSVRHYHSEDFDQLNTLGGEIQYKFNFAKQTNFFVGLNAGQAYIKVAGNGAVPSMSTNSAYYGGDAGFNFYLSEMIDLEVGAKYMALNVDMEDSGYNYTIDSMVSAYASVIIKWKMD